MIKMKRHVNINLKFMLKLANSFDQVISDTDKHKHYLIFVRFQLLRTDLNYWALSNHLEVKINSILAF